MKMIRTRKDLHEEMKTIILETTGDLRRAIARVVRGECKDFLAEHGEAYLDWLTNAVDKEVKERLAQLGSAAPDATGCECCCGPHGASTLDQHAADAVALTMLDATAIVTGALAVKAYHDQKVQDL